MGNIISILTTTRADFGLLKPLITKLYNVREFDIRIVATGMHLSKHYGLTYQEIEQSGFPIDKKIDILQEFNDEVSISKAMGYAMIKFSEYFSKLRPDLLIVLGDRYETLAVCCAAMNAQIPIAHLYGGETTEGAIDEAIRHSITKMSYLHFTSTDEYRKRVIQLGESPDRVYCVGGLGVENIISTELLSKDKLEGSLNFSLKKPYAVVTFHPVTLDNDKTEKQFKELLAALEKHKELNYIVTKANADAYGVIINELIDEYAGNHKNVIAFHSLGTLRYLSTLKFCKIVIGNSSSGLLEAPSFHIPTINIGDRQKGRIQSKSVINCRPISNEIDYAIQRALSDEFQSIVRKSTNPYGSGHTSDKIVEIIKEYIFKDKINLKKKFYDIKFEVK